MPCHPQGQARKPPVYVSPLSKFVVCWRCGSMARGEADPSAPFADYANVAMKVNVKLNGTNSVVNLGPAVSGKPTVGRSSLGEGTDADESRRFKMIFGADVSHPAPGSFAPSVAALVGTINREARLLAAHSTLHLLTSPSLLSSPTTDLPSSSSPRGRSASASSAIWSRICLSSSTRPSKPSLNA